MNRSLKTDLPDGGAELDIEIHGVQDVDRIITLEDLMERFEIDEASMDLTSVRTNSWETHFKLSEEAVYRAINYQIKATFAPSKEFWRKESILDMFREEVAKFSPRRDKVKRAPRLRGEDTALVVDMFDLHLGMLAWAEETGEDSWDSHIAVETALTAVEEVLNRVSHLNVSKIIFPMGNDLLHTDTTIQGKGGATTAGTPQDVDTRYLKMFRLAFLLMVQIIDMLREIAPVEIIVVPGNHDRERVAYLGECIWAYYRRDPEVEVHNEANLRKYTQFGVNMLGFTHGKDEKADALPLLMAQEEKEMWAETEYRIFHTGHIHRKRSMLSITTDTYVGVEVLSIPSLVPPDSWHAMKGFLGGGRAAEAYLYGYHSGPMGYFRYSLPRNNGE